VCLCEEFMSRVCLHVSVWLHEHAEWPVPGERDGSHGDERRVWGAQVYPVSQSAVWFAWHHLHAGPTFRRLLLRYFGFLVVQESHNIGDIQLKQDWQRIPQEPSLSWFKEFFILDSMRLYDDNIYRSAIIVLLVMKWNKLHSSKHYLCYSLYLYINLNLT